MRVSRFPLTVIAALVSVHVVAAQTKITAPKNKYTPQRGRPARPRSGRTSRAAAARSCATTP